LPQPATLLQPRIPPSISRTRREMFCWRLRLILLYEPITGSNICKA
jgi:hypothetical protein